MEFDKNRFFEKDDDMRCRIAIFLGFLDDDLAEISENVLEVCAEVVQSTGLEIGSFDFRRGRGPPRFFTSVSFFIEGQCHEKGAGHPVVGIVTCRIIEDLIVQGFEEFVTLSGLLAGVLTVSAATCGGVGHIIGFHVTEGHHGVVSDPIEESFMMNGILEFDHAVYEIGMELFAVITPFSVPIIVFAINGIRGYPKYNSLRGSRRWSNPKISEMLEKDDPHSLI